MAQINKPTDYFNTVLYTGNGSTQSITGVGFQPDWVWGKNRNTTNWHDLEDVVRGVTKRLSSNETDAEATETNNFTSFDSDGFSVGSGPNVNGSGNSIVVWNWLAGGTASSNTDGSITSSVSPNTTSGFSIVSWTGDGTDATIGHGLSSAPTIYFVKNRTDTADWRVGQVLTSSNNMTDGNGYYLELNDTKASTNPGSAVTWGATPTAPTSSVFTVGSNNAHNGSGDEMIAYCFHSVKGYSKMGSYTGNGSTDGTFVYTGFKPAFVMVKMTSSTGNWSMFDNKRSSFNVVDEMIKGNDSGAELANSSRKIDFNSSGFKIRANHADINTSGGTYIYMCFAETGLVGTNNIPATAR